MSEPFQRNLGIELVRVTEAAAMAAARFMGKGDKEGADDAAVRAMRYAINSIDMDGTIILGEGVKDQAPMLYIGEKVGNGHPPQVDVAVDPIDGTRLLSKGLPNALSVIALAEQGTMFYTDLVYMNKLAVGPDGVGCVDIRETPANNLKALAKAKGVNIGDLTVCILERPRNDYLVSQVRQAGARIKLISDGDVAGAIMAALPDTGIDMMLGIGGSPEAVVAAAAIKGLGGDFQAQLWPRDDAEKELAKRQHLDLNRVYRLDDLVKGEDVFFAATGITSGELCGGVRYFARGARTHSLVIRSRSGTVRYIEAVHNYEKLRRFSAISYEA